MSSGAPREVVLSLVSHTNVGKTTLARTLLRRDIGDVLDQAHVTDETERFVLFENAGGERVVLADNPGFGDSARLLRRLEGLDNPVGWLLGQVWDRFADRALYCSQEAVRHVRDEADVVLYLANASEDPAAAGYVEPELRILSWIGRPVVLLLNQTGEPREEATRLEDVSRWREAAGAVEAVHDVVELDAFTRCWVQEGLLYDRIRALAPEPLQDLLAEWIAHWREEHEALLARSVDEMAALLATTTQDAEPLPAEGRTRRHHENAARALGRRLESGLAALDERLIALHGLEGEAAEALRVELGDVSAPPLEAGPWQSTLWGGLVGGAMGGLAADVATGGLSLGGGALAGAILGAAGGRGLAWGQELLRGGERTPRVAWTMPFLERLCEDLVLRYLAVAHFGRGAGSFRVRDHPALFRGVARRALASARPPLRDRLQGSRLHEGPDARSRATAELAGSLEAAVRTALATLHPAAMAVLRP